MDRIHRRARIADGVLVAITVAIGWSAVGWGPNRWTLPWMMALAALAGLVARAPGLRERRWPTIIAGGIVGAWAMVLTLPALARNLEYVDTVDRVAVIVLGEVVLPALALFALARGARWAPFSVGLAVAGLEARWWLDARVPLVLAAFAVARWTFTESAEPARQRVSSLGAGACAGLASLALVYDLWARTWDTAPWVFVDGLASAGPRMALEVAVILGAAQLARGRTHGLLVLVASGIGLALAVSSPTELPRVWSECTQRIHPLFDLVGPVPSVRSFVDAVLERPALFLALPLAVLPWALPIVRALRSPAHEPDLRA